MDDGRHQYQYWASWSWNDQLRLRIVWYLQWFVVMSHDVLGKREINQATLRAPQKRVQWCLAMKKPPRSRQKRLELFGSSLSSIANNSYQFLVFLLLPKTCVDLFVRHHERRKGGGASGIEPSNLKPKLWVHSDSLSWKWTMATGKAIFLYKQVVVHFHVGESEGTCFQATDRSRWHQFVGRCCYCWLPVKECILLCKTAIYYLLDTAWIHA